MARRKKTTRIKRKASKGSIWKNYGKPIILLSFILLVFIGLLILVYDPFTPGHEVFGTVQSAYKPDSRYTTSIRFVIKLDSDKVVHVRADSMGPFRKGRRVILQELTSSIFHRKEYRFLRYPDTEPIREKQLDIKDYEIPKG